MKTLVSWGRNPLLSLWIFFPFAFPYVSIFTDLVIRKNEVKIENEGKSEKERTQETRDKKINEGTGARWRKKKGA